MDSLFFALQPEPAAAGRAVELAESLRAAHDLKAQATAVERLHVTLHHLGALREETVTRALRAAATLDCPAVEVRFDKATSFKSGGKKRPLVLLSRQALQPLQDFRSTLGVALSLHGVDVDDGSFRPHLTLLRDARAVPEQSVGPVAWKAREFVLLQSLVGQGRYVVLGRWPLNG
ncbi:RNA 2',3'-cyclic phosphodiesterase [Variovorax sp. J31P207]|uniref:RNA 2',3'-cyclic phosphodiesterase n=1 Tax=Variovorax sp. J31P207 TaxID=3053510 RepID=UPI002574F888|nr:RNA 2',3'-cyclic phosphodiesterase [Variovorax sp. J31P207]MDM0072006.1 RNA 2',3'-cyclic phosphodiesterase [Variovorax sp. J31P207]